jgi:hypothetical protein
MNDALMMEDAVAEVADLFPFGIQISDFSVRFLGGLKRGQTFKLNAC